MRFGNQPHRRGGMHRRIEIDCVLSSMTPKAVPAAPLGLPARQCHELTPTLRPLLRSSGALVMLPSLLSSMHARDTAGAQRFSYCRYGFVLRKREALLRC